MFPFSSVSCLSTLFPSRRPSPPIWEICMLLCSLKCAPTQVPSTIYKVRFTIYEVRFGGDGAKLFKIMEMEKFYVAPEVEVLEVAVEKGFEGSVGDIEVNPTPEV